MSTLHYFQRYSQKENWLTNNTLLLLRHFYFHDHIKFEKFINDLDPQIEIQVGPVFSQQIRGKSSVPDGSIAQKPFNILVEAKQDGKLDETQLLSHSEEFKKDEDNILLTFTKERENDHRQEKLTKKVQENLSSEITAQIVFLTYEEIYDKIGKLLKEYDQEMLDILEDYANMCESEGVFEKKSHTMIGVSCGRSYKENIEYSIYYDPVDRNHNLPFNYLGIYLNKAIRHIGKVEKVVGCDLVEGRLRCNNLKYQSEFDKLTEQEKKNIISIIYNTDVYNLKRGKKFFLLSDLTETNYKKKETAPAIQSKRYFFFNEIEGFEKDMTANVLAKLVDGKEWE